jgi:hypothetical protein
MGREPGHPGTGCVGSRDLAEVVGLQECKGDFFVEGAGHPVAGLFVYPESAVGVMSGG